MRFDPILIMWIFLPLMVIYAGCSESSPLKRSTNSVCSRSTPCGWLVYQEYVRTPDYYVHSPCSCASDQKCVKDADDVSISALVYRCRSPEEAGNQPVFPADDGSQPNETSG